MSDLIDSHPPLPVHIMSKGNNEIRNPEGRMKTSSESDVRRWNRVPQD